MDRSEALRSIRYDLFEYIQKKVTVDFDNSSQSPDSFTLNGETRLINEVLCSFQLDSEKNINAFLIGTDDGEVYLIYFNVVSQYPWKGLSAGFWVLNLRILKDNELMTLYREDRKMLINITLNRVVNFHGHMCPDLILGGKVCEYAQKLLEDKNEFKKGLSIIAENCTSALDAIQVLLGTTIGNQRLKVIDYGKHNYTILYDKGRKGLKFSLRTINYQDEDEYRRLAEKAANNQASLNDVLQFQKLLDDRTRYLLGLSPEDIFDMEDTGTADPLLEKADHYIACFKCGQQVLKSRIVSHQDKDYCMPCFQRINLGNFYYNLQ